MPPVKDTRCDDLRAEATARLGHLPGICEELNASEFARYTALDQIDRAVEFFRPAVLEARREREQRIAAN